MKTNPRILMSDIAAINLALKQGGIKKHLRVERRYDYKVLELCDEGRDSGRDIVAGSWREIHCAVMGFEGAVAVILGRGNHV